MSGISRNRSARLKNIRWTAVSMLVLLSGCSAEPINRTSTSVEQKALNRSFTTELTDKTLSLYQEPVRLGDMVRAELKAHPDRIIAVCPDPEYCLGDVEVADGLTELRSAKQLRQLTLIQFRINDRMLEPISALPLNTLFVESADIRDAHALKAMKQLSHVALDANPLTSAAVQNLCRLRELKRLALNKTDLNDHDLAPLLKLRHLTDLSLKNCPNVTADFVAQLRLKPGLRVSYSNLPATRDWGWNIPDKMRECLDDGDFREAESTGLRALRHWEKQPTSNGALVAEVYLHLSTCAKQAGRERDALAYIDRALAQIERQDRSGDSYIRIKTLHTSLHSQYR